jgi:hypothetical protein
VQCRVVISGVQNYRKTCTTGEATKHVKGLAAEEIERGTWVKVKGLKEAHVPFEDFVVSLP